MNQSNRSRYPYVESDARVWYIAGPRNHEGSKANVLQYVPVQPHTRYTLSAYARAENITTASGPFLAVVDPFHPGALQMETAPLSGSTGWTRIDLTFRTAPDTRLIVIRLARAPSRKFDNKLSGTLWLDEVSLREAPPMQKYTAFVTINKL